MKNQIVPHGLAKKKKEEVPHGLFKKKKKMVPHGFGKNNKKKKVVHGDTPFLPDEIISDILKRLPVKSLIRFQCTCKHWKSLIKSPSFVADHLHHPSNQNPRLLFQQRGADANPLHLFVPDCKIGPLDVQELPSMSYYIYCRPSIIGTYNGLICVRVPSYALFLWNPATREVRRVPGDDDDDDDFYFGFGFGYCPLADDYKIVKIFNPSFVNKRKKVYLVEVYSLKTDSWREIKSGNIIRGKRKFFANASVNGSIYWNVRRKGVPEDEILSFDLAKEVFTWIPLPRFNNSSITINIFVYDKKLALFCAILSNLLASFWVMEEGVDASGCKEWNWTKIENSNPYLSHLDGKMIFGWKLNGVDYTLLYVESLVPISNIDSEEPTS